MKRPTIRILWAAGALAGIAIVGFASLAIFVWLSIGDNKYEQRPFEKEEWLHGTNAAQLHFPRLGMSDDLIEKRTLQGMEKKEVLAMLGEPAKKDIQWSKNDRFDLLYWLGPERGFMSVDSEWLGIIFDKTGKVSQYKLVRD